MALYMDSSALVKLVVEEAESEELREFVGDREMASSQIARTELVRAVARTQPAAVDAAEDLVGAVTLIAVSRVLTSRAAWVLPRELRSLDALHVASAIAMSANLQALITYDRRMVEAGRMAGLRVMSPGDKPA